jgi:hypothetical protein
MKSLRTWLAVRTRSEPTRKPVPLVGGLIDREAGD